MLTRNSENESLREMSERARASRRFGNCCENVQAAWIKQDL